LRWHRSGFTAFWRWKSRNRAGRPKVDRELRDLIGQMSKENPLWGAPRRFIKIRHEMFPDGKFPCSALITVSNFAHPGILIEIQGVAVV
jgi:hypothetical protein